MVSDFIQEIIDGKLRVVDPKLMTSRCNIPSAMTTMCLKEMKKDIVEYKELEPIGGSYKIDNGLKLSRFTTPHVCGRPYKIAKDGNFIVTADRDKHSILLYDNSFNLHNSYYLANNSDNRYPISFATSEDRIYIGTDYYRLICVDKVSKDVIWEFGTFNARGKCSDGKIGRVLQLQMLPDGNLVIVTQDGAGDANRWYGTVELFTPDGQWIKTLLQDKGLGQGVDLQTHYPQSVRVYENMVYVGKQTEIDIFTYDSTNQDFTFVQTIEIPAVGKDTPILRDFVVEQDAIYIAAPNLKKIVGFSLSTGKIIFSVGHFNYESSSFIRHEGNGLNYPNGILVDDGKIYVTDSSNYNIFEVFMDDYIYPEYNIPTDIDIVYASLDVDGNTAKVPVGEEPPKLNLVYKTR